MKRLFLLLTLATVMTAPAIAQTTSLGRLFFTPEERIKLDQVRKNGGNGATSKVIFIPAAPIAPGIVEATHEQIILDGFVKRSSGKTTAWINRLPQNENESPQGISITGQNTQSGTISMRLSSGKEINLKAGQTFDVVKGRIREGYEENPVPTDDVNKK